MKKYNLNLLNEDIRIVSDKGDAHVEGLRQYILTTIRRFDNVSTPFPMPYLNKALYACVFLADELDDKRCEIEVLKAKIAELEDKSKGKGK